MVLAVTHLHLFLAYLSHYQVYYLDYGFFVETSPVNMLKIHQDFLSLPFQATCVRLAGIVNRNISFNVQ